MAVYNYRKFKVSIDYRSRKTQGLKTGDIVRRQYFDGQNLVYSLMCVLSYGYDEVVDENNEVVQQPYFIGALLEGDALLTNDPTEKHIERLYDFARITNLFDTNRSGALYLTASDEQSPFMDVIDGIGRNESLCWPENIATADYADSESQYVVLGADAVTVDYIPSVEDNYRVVHIKRNNTVYYDFIGLQQDFYKYVANPNRVLISYKVKGSRNLNLRMWLGYRDGTESDFDGTDQVAVTTEWQYKLHAITVDRSGRHIRAFKLFMDELQNNDEVWISDFNIILLSSVSNFGEASKIRIGRLSGVNDPVFGTLDGYGSYIQKLFASQAAHISGTLTAGDENGFASTFYAGKIHRNAFINSLDVGVTTGITIEQNVESPTGMGAVYSATSSLPPIKAQLAEWYQARIGKRFTFSFWVQAKCACQLSVIQNSKTIGTIQISEQDVNVWKRKKVVFDIQASNNPNSDLLLSVAATWNNESEGEHKFLFTSPQLESGELATQYQPTDDVLAYTDEYGAWFNRGGIGGTIQNPLLKLNEDGKGSITTKRKSLMLRQDGSGYLANENIKWNEDGDVTFGKNVTMGWDNLDDSVKGELVSKSIRITGPDMFTLLGDMTGADPITQPADITLTLEEENLQSTSSQRQWSYMDGYDWVPFEGENGKTLTIFPFATYWNNMNSLTVRCDVQFGEEHYTDTFTVKKQMITGYTMEIVSSNGNTFKNNDCETVLTALVYYQGKLVQPSEYEHYTFRWRKYHLPDIEHEIEGWSEGIDITQNSITLDYEISGQDFFTCELATGDMFPYEFPITF